ncbi:beta-lactamase domain-containing protein 2 [Strongylocentrotus purpuratus]|uniref:Beta-lactamase-related domain-containing protein n=1 Tax=Strongylocentrotus purpuratus TaxID=7668 RepID=A0A7M7RBK0_STRPU|nr:beta-lactamase domain-containing protein 2 [Strongylocentrotus purpuratus]|eukprot:XP_781241.2 PREDICTED: beta-lactamase domain-containing protein 2 [Strongylocentrotus purpuratus]
MMALWTSAALVAVTAVAVLWLPGFFRQQPPVIVDGFVAKGFEEVEEAFRRTYETNLNPREGGSAFSVYYKGEKVVDIWGGYADFESRQEWRRDTISVFFSSTKGVAAICIAMLVERGLLDYDKPVSLYWPEFAQKGKGNITVRQLLEHQAGLVLAAPPGLSFDLLSDVAKAGDRMSSTEPLWDVDGKTHGYHAITFGPLTNELLRRVDPKHRTMGQFFKEELAQPFGLDFYIGLPLEENYRTARLLGGGSNVITDLLQGISSPTNRQIILHMMQSDLLTRIIENSGIGNIAVLNNPYNRQVELPSALGIGTAESVAKLYGILAAGGVDSWTNRTLLTKPILSKLFTSTPPTFDKTLGVPIAFNLGLMVFDSVEGEILYGHPGARGQIGFADPKNQLGMGFVSNTMSPFFLRDDPRTGALLSALYKCTRRIENK